MRTISLTSVFIALLLQLPPLTQVGGGNLQGKADSLALMFILYTSI